MEGPPNSVINAHGVYMGGSWLSWYEKHRLADANNVDKKSDEKSNPNKGLSEENGKEVSNNTQVCICYYTIIIE